MVKDCDSTHGTLLRVDEIKLDKDNISEDLVYRNMLIKAVLNPNLIPSTSIYN